MTDRGDGTWLKAATWPSVLAGMTMTIGGGEPLALPLPPINGGPAAAHYQMIEDGADPATSSPGAQAGPQAAAPFAELTEALMAARVKLEQLERATAALAGVAALRAELSAKEEENRRLQVEHETLRERSAEWQRADEAAKAQISGLGQALDESAADIKKLEGELATLRWQNAQLGTSLGRARSEQEALSTDLGARVDELTASVEASEAEIERLNQELSGRSADLVAANEAQQHSAMRVAELEDGLASAKGDLGRVGAQLSSSAERLSEANAALAVSEQERETALGTLDEEQARGEQLRDALVMAEADLQQARAANRDLEIRFASLEQAAAAATDAARQNLRAVESQVAALNSTLAEAELSPLAAGAMQGETAAGGAASDDAVAPARHQPAGTEMIPAAADDRGTEISAVAPGAGPANGESALVKLSEPESNAAIGPLAMLTDELPVEGRIQAQSLLADLDAETDPQGLKLTVPGGELFTVNSEQIRNSAHDSLVKVAELINLYEGRPIMIIGHTDAVGATEYNRTLSLRRASLVKEFFVENFDVEAERLATQGMGEQRPIASNATAAGRRANRRVEVLILK